MYLVYYSLLPHKEDNIPIRARCWDINFFFTVDTLNTRRDKKFCHKMKKRAKAISRFPKLVEG